MNPVRDESRWRRVPRTLVAFVIGFAMASGLLWASSLGVDDRNRASRFTSLNLSAACVQRDGADAVAYIAGAASPVGWRCAHPDGDGWTSSPIAPDEGCQLLFGPHSRARAASPENPFTWECRR
jgi:hypothetical protein